MALPLALTLGDPAGIGPELALKRWLGRRDGDPAFTLLADPAATARAARALDLAVEIAGVEPEEAVAAFSRALPVTPLGVPYEGVPGRPSVGDAPATVASIRRAVELVHEGRARALVTNPIAKKPLYDAGFPHPGHTEYLAELAQEMWGRPATPVMMLWSETLAVALATVHVPLGDVPRALTREGIAGVGRIVAGDLARLFGIARPRLVFAGLNPHAGEGGAIGREEIETIAPAIADLRAEGIDAVGPLPADTMFHAKARARYDAAVAMYHDQGLVALKTLAFDEGVNVTLGLPFVRTSPDHGTAFDIAGRGIADDTSLAAALRLAARISRAEAK